MHHANRLLAIAAVSICIPAAAVRGNDYVVDPSGANGAYKTVQAAINGVPVGTAQNRTRILIKPGTYTELLKVNKDRRFITLVGQGAKPEDTLLTYNLNYNSKKAGGGEVGTAGSSSTVITANDFSADNVTFANSTARGVERAVAIRPMADRLAFNKCRFLGYQDTLYPCVGRQYYKDCYVTGTTDFIFGDATVVFDRCTINSSGPKYLTAASTPQTAKFGFVFLDCTLATSDANSKANSIYLGRPWRPYGAVAFVRCKMGPHINATGWDNWGKASNEKTARYLEFGSMNLDGKALDVSKRVGWSGQMSEQQAKEYTVDNVLSGTDKWNPTAAFAAGKN